MKTVMLLVLCSMILCGCVTTSSYYSKPSSKGYTKSIWKSQCEQCDRIFTISTYLLEEVPMVSCPYCGDTQNTKMARNRGQYYENQEKRQRALAMLGALGSMKTSSDETEQSISNVQVIGAPIGEIRGNKIYSPSGGVHIIE